MFGIAPFTALLWTRDISPDRETTFTSYIYGVFSNPYAAHDWLLQEIASRDDATGAIEIFDSWGKCCYSDFVTGSDHPSQPL